MEKIIQKLNNGQITLCPLKPEDQDTTEKFIEDINKSNIKLEPLYEGYIDTIPFKAFKNTNYIYIFTKTTNITYQINDQFNYIMITKSNDCITKTSYGYYLIIKNKNNISMQQEEKIENANLSEIKYKTTKKYYINIKNLQQTFEITSYWNKLPKKNQKPSLFFINITKNNETKTMSYKLNLNTNTYESKEDSYNNMISFLKQYGISIEHSEQFISSLQKFPKPNFIKAIETLITNNIQIQNNTLTCSGYQFKITNWYC